MNEEEKKTIEKFIEKCYKYDESVEIKGRSVGEECRMLNTVCKALNLIEKLQKENDELRAKWDKDTNILQNKLDYANADRIDLAQQNKELKQDYYNLINKIENKIDRFDYKFEKAKRQNNKDKSDCYWNLIINFKELLESEE